MSAAVASTDKADKVRELHERLVAQVEALVTGEDWARYLSVAARFHSYSTGTRRYSKRPYRWWKSGPCGSASGGE